MGRHVEYLNGGLVDGPDPATLQAGQLADVQNAIYTPNAPALQRAKGRVTFGTATAGDANGNASGDVAGLRDAHFDNGDHYLIAMMSGVRPAYSTAAVTGAGVFGELLTGITAAGSGLEAVHYQNRFYLFNGTSASASGIGTNVVFYLSATAANTPPTVRQHGMVPVGSPPVTSSAGGTFALTVTGYYEYWYTELAQVTQDGVSGFVESTFAGSAATVYVTSLSQVPLLASGAAVNANVTHWRVYRSPKKETAADKMFPDGFAIATLSTATGQVADTLASTTNAVVSAGGVQTYTKGGWINTATLTAANNAYASATAAFNAISALDPTFGKVAVSGFIFNGFKGQVAGIQVEIKAYVSGTTPVSVNAWIGSKDPGTNFFRSNPAAPWQQCVRTVFVSGLNSGAAGVYTYGSSADRWAPPDLPGFVDTDFDTNFMVALAPSWIGGGVTAVAVDYVRVTVNSGGTSDQNTIVFPTVAYTFGDVVAEVGKNGKPPSSSTGDFFEDSLAVNDVTNPGLIRYSFAGSPDYFPETYFLDFETRDNDVVRCIKTVNNRLIVMLDKSTWRVNYLPSERDASFDRGKAADPISQQYGCINAMCACTFSMDESTQLLAWVSQKGIHITDGFSFRTLSNNLDWGRILPRSTAAKAIALINDPENQDLVFYFTDTAVTGLRQKALHLSYATQHMLDGQRLKVSGRVNMENWATGVVTSYAQLRSAWPVPRVNGDTSIFLGYGSATAAGGGIVWIESGANIPSPSPELLFDTRRMFLAAEGNEFRLNEVYAYIGSYTGQPGIDMQPFTIKTNDDSGVVTKGLVTRQFANRKLGKWQFRQVAEGLTLEVKATGNPQNDMAIEYLILDGEGFGQEDSGKGT